MYSSAQLGKNIRKIRTERKMTQAELAARLHITAQNISKWENSLCMPDVNNLCLLASALGVTPDRLLGKSEDAEAMIAVDGGGTKTEFCLFTKSGEVLARAVLGSTNPNAVGIDTTTKLLGEGIDELLLRANTVTSVFAGISGCGIEKNGRPVREFLEKRYPDKKILVGGDIPNIIYSEDYYDECLVAIMGTGSVIAVKSNGNITRVGGWGYLFDEGFSGYGLGRDAITAALAEQDGLGAPTLITEILQSRLGESIVDGISLLYKEPCDKIAALSSAVFDAYDGGDAVAYRIIERRIGHLISSLLRAAELHGGGRHVVIAGGLSKRRDVLEKFLVGVPFEFHFPTLPPIYGACRYCAIKNGGLLENFEESFKNSYTT